MAPPSWCVSLPLPFRGRPVQYESEDIFIRDGRRAHHPSPTLQSTLPLPIRTLSLSLSLFGCHSLLTNPTFPYRYLPSHDTSSFTLAGHMALHNARRVTPRPLRATAGHDKVCNSMDMRLSGYVSSSLLLSLPAARR
jgi:hypothetical protein